MRFYLRVSSVLHIPDAVPSRGCRSAVAARARSGGSLRPPHAQRSHVKLSRHPGSPPMLRGSCSPRPFPPSSSARLFPRPRRSRLPRDVLAGSPRPLLRLLLLPAAPQPPEAVAERGTRARCPRPAQPVRPLGPLQAPGRAAGSKWDIKDCLGSWPGGKA